MEPVDPLDLGLSAYGTPLPIYNFAPFPVRVTVTNVAGGGVRFIARKAMDKVSDETCKQ